MKTNKSYRIKIIYFLLIFTCFVTPKHLEAQKKNKKNKSNVEVAADKASDTKKTKSIKELVKASKKFEGLFSIYQDTITGTLQMIIPEESINNDYIYFSQITDGPMDAGRLVRGSYRGSKIFKIKKYFNKIEFITQNTSFYFDPNSTLSKSKDANTSEGNMASIKIEAYDKKTKAYLIKVDDLFLSETLSQIKPASSSGQPSSSFKLGSLNKDKSKIIAIKNYPENTDVNVEYVYTSPSVSNSGSNALADPRNVSIKIHHSFIAMPDNDYEIRLDDPRVGYFITKVDDKTSTSATPHRDLVHRWHLKKKDSSATLSEPVTPITWWIENSTPLEWRQTIKDAVLQWNVAFEKAGFKNAIVVKIQPDDADWDAGDIRYNVLRWTSSPKPPFGGYGPSFVNPKTGQILGADIMLEFAHFTNRVFYDRVYESTPHLEPYHHTASEFHDSATSYCTLGHQIQQDVMFAKTAAMVSESSDFEMERIKKESMTALIMHEVGHTLGLNHNMKASHLFSPEQLADADFIKGKCLTASVMDYAALNITRDRSKQGQYDDVAVGPYDIWAIQFGYTPFDLETDREALLNLSTNPELIFGNDADDMRSPGKAIDPRVMISDQSNNPIAYSIDRILLSTDLMKNAKEKFTKSGQSYQELRNVYNLLSAQKATAAGIISRYIGGVYVDRAMAGQEGATKPYTPVSLEDQKRAMAALNSYVFAPNAFDVPNDLYNYLAQQRRGFDFRSSPEDPKIHSQVLAAQKNVLNHLLHYNTLQRISDSELYGNEYSLSTFMTDLNQAIFKSDIYGNVNTFRQNLQLEYTTMLIDLLIGKQKDKFQHTAKSLALYNLKSIRTMAAATGNTISRAHKQHLRILIDNAIDEIK
ncbi:hypothetical protein APS56_01820 [Pseudalgibacter alginicilyticus]|uniref:Matrixin n=1 Tax=Pseudalgibacter alginicilyticus TaxID=1736674 RepID=A0A0P0D965_9FLAO|nr:zinc-dependent metalloprotease [Pseudalgibacter alginicilyticus]ALJ06688.1 hypothetical protein APS56_01820 [Pseudalgibacter alginicilyticus]